MWINRLLQKYNSDLEEIFADTEDYGQALEGLPLFTLRWLFVMDKLGKNEGDCVVEYLKAIESVLTELCDLEKDKIISKCINAGQVFVDYGVTTDLLKYLKKYSKK